MRANRARILLLGAAVLAVGALAARADCYPESAQAATKAANDARDWRDLQKVYAEFRICDSGAVGAAFSKSVTRLLADRWDALSTLHRLAAADPKFERFVLRHVDPRLTSDDARTIRANAGDHCARGSRALCAAILERIAHAQSD